MMAGMTWTERGNRPEILISMKIKRNGKVINLTLERAVDESATITKPLGNQETPRQEPLQKTGEKTTVLRFGEFCGVHGNCRGEHTNGCTGDETTGDKHAHVDSTTLEGATENGDERSDGDGFLSSELVTKDHVDHGTQHGTSLESRNNTTSGGIRGVVEVLQKVRLSDGRSDDTGVISEKET